MNNSHLFKIYKTLTNEQRKTIMFLFPLFFLRIIVEAISIGAIFPFIKIITEPERIASIIDNKEFYKKFLNIAFDYNSFNQDLKIDFLIYFSVFLLISIFLIKNLYLYFLNYIEIKFYNKINDYYPKKLFLKYTKLPYEKFIDKNSAYMIRNMNQSQSFVDSIQSINSLFIEIIILLIILTGLFYLNFLVTMLTLLIFIIFLGTFYLLTRKKLSIWGYDRHYHDGEKLKSQHHGFGLIKDLKIFNLENYFPEKFSEHNKKSLISSRNISLVQFATRYLLEIMLVLVFSILIMSQHFIQQSFIDTLPLIAIFAAAGYRLMPSVSNILISIQRLKFNLPVISRLYSELIDTENDSYSKLREKRFKLNQPNIVINNVNFSYKNSDQKILDNVSLKINFGSIIGIIGESGSGKSTLINLITGLLQPSSGEIFYEDKKSKNKFKNIDKIGYVPQNVYLLDSSLKKNISLIDQDKEIDEMKLNKSIFQSNLIETIKNLPNGIDTQVGEKGLKISGGQLQRVGLARALYDDPDILILDEATSGLDIDNENEILINLNQLKGSRTIIIISHRSNSLKYCEKVFKIEDKKIGVYK